jgi:hypothetical protein
MFTHSNCTGIAGRSVPNTIAINRISLSPMLVGNVKTMNFVRLWKTPRPSSTAASDRRKVVVGQEHIGGLLGDVSPAHAHGDADVSLPQRRSVIDTVTGHGHDMSATL